MALSSRHLVLSTIGSIILGGVVIACGSDGSKFDDGKGDQGTFGDAGFGDLDGTALDPYANDPPPSYCGPDGGAAPPPVSGTESCPSDKNKPGCPCTPGATAKCWTGYRKDRGLGICHDGDTVCSATSEFGGSWGECTGQQLPKQNAVGAEACDCFSLGKWDIANTSPCFTKSKDGNGNVTSVTTFSSNPGAGERCIPNPTADWSTDKLKVDCAGTFTLCFRIKAGDYNNPSPNDCTIGESCVQNATYADTAKELTLPNLPAWTGKDNTCAKKWEVDTPSNKSPGYGEMIVKGQTVTCDEVGNGDKDYVFHRVQYCPRICRTTNPPEEGGYQPDSAECKACQAASSGEFTPTK